jgi:phenylalanyl-tRNA synthetase beta chain
MLELGQPLHAFNYDALPEGQVIVRPTVAGEKIITLDGVERDLPEGALAICDVEKPVCIAGVMGNAETEVGPQTRNIFLESAHFNPLSIRRTSKLLGLTTEASYRFERTVDPNLVPIALERAAELLADLADGEVVLGRIDLYPQPVVPVEIPIRPARTNAILGTSLSNKDISRALSRLGMRVADGGDPFLVTVPTFRPDLVKEIDLIEEVARMVGYADLPETLPAATGSGAGDEPIGVFTAQVRELLVGLGLREVFTHSLAAPSAFDDPDRLSKRVAIRSALSAELSGLRTALVPNILDVTALNLRQKQADVRVFEVGKTFLLGDKPGIYVEKRRVAAVLTGQESPRSWSETERKPVTFYTAKGIVEALLSILRTPQPVYKAEPVHGMHPGRSAVIEIGGKRIGYVAEVDPDAVKRDLDVPASVGRVAVFELDLEALMAQSVDDRRYRSLPKYPAVSRDLAVVVDLSTAYGDIEKVARAASDNTLLEDLSVQSIYTGERVSAGKKSVAIRLTFRAPDRTLTDADVDAQMSAVENALVDGVGAARR